MTTPHGSDPTKIYVLDTSVVLYDSDALNNFDEHDVAIPLTVLEELDGFKKGNNVINLHAREFMRHLDRLSEREDLRHWIPLNGSSRGRFRVITDQSASAETIELLGSRKNDHRILAATLGLARREGDRPVVLVSKDINLRIKARALELQAEDYETVKIRDIDHLYRGSSELETDDGVIDRLHKEGSLPAEEVLDDAPPANHYFIARGPTRSALAFYDPVAGHVERVVKRTGYGISPRNAEQTFALHAILNPDVPLVTLCGAAGTGKTLLALAGALEMRRFYRQVYLARPIVPLSNRDIGYLPGDVQSKIDPYMQPLWDNLGVIKNQFKETSKDFKRIQDMLDSGKLHIMPLTYIRGRSFANVIFIIDEAQNLTPHEVKTIVTRAGEGTKIIFTGDIFQIDTPYLDAQTNGLSYLIDRVKGNPLYAHVRLDKGERSELANLAGELL